MRRIAGGMVALAISVASTAAQRAPVTFEVASVRVVEPLDIQKVLSGQQSPAGVTQTPGRVDIIGLPLGALLTTAFKVKSNQLAGPSWLPLDPGDQLRSGEARFDIHATLPAGATADQMPEMLQALLAERFKLAFHRERRNQSGLALVVAKDGPKLTKAAPESSPPAARTPPSSQRMGTSSDGMVHIERERLTMAQLANLLSGMLKRPVADMTNLPGAYKVWLDLSPADLGAVVPAAAPAAEPGGGTSVFKSVEQLGLRLESRTAPTDYIVIDHVEKLPTQN